MGLRDELARLLGKGRPHVPPMPCDCEDPERSAEPPAPREERDEHVVTPAR